MLCSPSQGRDAAMRKYSSNALSTFLMPSSICRIDRRYSSNRPLTASVPNRLADEFLFHYTACCFKTCMA